MAITLPGEGEIMDLMEVADPDAVHAVRCFIKKALALQLKEEFLIAVSFLIFYKWESAFSNLKCMLLSKGFFSPQKPML